MIRQPSFSVAKKGGLPSLKRETGWRNFHRPCNAFPLPFHVVPALPLPLPSLWIDPQSQSPLGLVTRSGAPSGLLTLSRGWMDGVKVNGYLMLKIDSCPENTTSTREPCHVAIPLLLPHHYRLLRLISHLIFLFPVWPVSCSTCQVRLTTFLISE